MPIAKHESDKETRVRDRFASAARWSVTPSTLPDCSAFMRVPIGSYALQMR
jgi:hypothetical protein